MSSSCAKYEDRLSAYMDGQLSPEEMAEVASHLEQCPSCSALLEKMRKLEEIGEGVMPDFDEALMADLSARIEAGIEETEKEGAGSSRKAKIIPVWYSYVAVAASIAIVFFVGRMAFKETGADLQRHQLPKAAPEIIMQQPAPEVPSQAEEPVEPPAEPKSKGRAEMHQVAMPKPVTDEEQETGDKSFSREKASTPSEVTGSGKEEDWAQEALIQSPTAVADESEISNTEAGKKGQAAAKEEVYDDFSAYDVPEASIITGKITDGKTGEPLVGATVQLEGTSKGARTDFDGEFAIIGVPPDTYNLVYSAIGYQTKKVDAVPVSPDERLRADAGIDMLPGDLGKTAEVVGGRGKDYFSTGKSASSKQLKQMALSEEAPAITIDSLAVLYKAATAGFESRMMFGLRETTDAAKPVQPVERYRALLDSVEALPKAQETYHRLETLYFKARVSYDLYCETNDKKYLEMAGRFKDAMGEILSERLEEYPDDRTLLNYKAEIERWRF